MNMPPTRSEKILKIIIVCCIVATLVIVAYLNKKDIAIQFSKLRENVFPSTKSDEKINDEVAALLAQVGKLMILPEGEIPAVATVSDIDALVGQPFFKDAEVGDVVIIYSKAEKAILYNPREQKIVNVASLSIELKQ